MNENTQTFSYVEEKKVYGLGSNCPLHIHKLHFGVLHHTIRHEHEINLVNNLLVTRSFLANQSSRHEHEAWRDLCHLRAGSPISKLSLERAWHPASYHAMSYVFCKHIPVICDLWSC